MNTSSTGAGAKIEAGESINIIPAELMVRVGESLRIINDDDRGHVVGVFFVGQVKHFHKNSPVPVLSPVVALFIPVVNSLSRFSNDVQ